MGCRHSAPIAVQPATPASNNVAPSLPSPTPLSRLQNVKGAKSVISPSERNEMQELAQQEHLKLDKAVHALIEAASAPSSKSLVIEVGLKKQCAPLEEFPEAILRLKHLTELKMSGHKFNTIPDAIAEMVNLEVLDLSGNQITTLPASFPPKLRILNLSDNIISILPNSIGEVTELTNLLVFKNMISIIPESLGKLTKLEELNLFNNRIADIPSSLSNTPCLRDVNFGSNQLTSFPSGWKNCTRIALQFNNISRLSLIESKSLEVLQVNHNSLTNFPELYQEAPMTLLDIASNNITNIPTYLSNFTSLKTFNARGNQLKTLPESLTLLSVELFDFQENQFETIPACLLREGAAVRTLLFNKNNLTVISPDILNLKHLSRFGLEVNPLKESDSLRELLVKTSSITLANGGWLRVSGKYFGFGGRAPTDSDAEESQAVSPSSEKVISVVPVSEEPTNIVS